MILIFYMVSSSACFLSLENRSAWKEESSLTQGTHKWISLSFHLVDMSLESTPFLWDTPKHHSFLFPLLLGGLEICIVLTHMHPDQLIYSRGLHLNAFNCSFDTHFALSQVDSTQFDRSTNWPSQTSLIKYNIARRGSLELLNFDDIQVQFSTS